LLLFVPVSSRKFQVLLPRHKVLFGFSHTSVILWFAVVAVGKFFILFVALSQ
jgi:hypothetical protein